MLLPTLLAASLGARPTDRMQSHAERACARRRQSATR
jgi:hypothetical protein